MKICADCKHVIDGEPPQFWRCKKGMQISPVDGISFQVVPGDFIYCETRRMAPVCGPEGLQWESSSEESAQ